MVSEGCVTALAALLLSSVDMFTLQHSLLALCNLLTEPDNHNIIIQQGLIMTLSQICQDKDNDLMKDFCALALLNLSCSTESRKHIVNSGGFIPIMMVAQDSSQVTKRRCAATLCNISYYTNGISKLVAADIIPCVVELLQSKDMETVHYSCAVLCHVCCSESFAKVILESGAVVNLVRGVMEGDVKTKQMCGAVISALSFYDICRLTLIELDVIEALKSLSNAGLTCFQNA